MKLGVLFSGQGAQYVGMGLDFIENVPELKAQLKNYSNTLNMDLESLLNDPEKINDTRYTQPLMVVVEIIIHDYLVSLGLKIDGYTGFSLGEFSGLYAAGYFDADTLLKIIDERAKLMQQAAINTPGAMAAIISLSDSDVELVCETASNKDDLVVAANYNAPGQLVISGSKLAVEKAMALAKEKGARRALPLNVSGAFHSPYMKDAGANLRKFVENFKVETNRKALYANTSAQVLNQSDIFNEIEQQMSHPVYFKQTIEQMIKDGFDTFVEVGPGQVLTGLVKKINPEVKVISVSKFEDINNIKEILV